MKLITYSFIILSACAGALHAQAPQWQWAHTAGLASYWQNSALDPQGNIYVTGSFAGNSITFGSTTLTASAAYSGGIFLAKYDPSGNLIWAKQPTYSTDDLSVGIGVDSNSNIYISGIIVGDSITFGNTVLHGVHPPIIAQDDSAREFFLAKYDVNGNVLWAKSASGRLHGEYLTDSHNSIAIDRNNNVFVSGAFYSDSMGFDQRTIYNSYGNFGSLSDIFIVKYDPTGTVLWAKNAGGKLQDATSSIAVDGAGNLYIAGACGSEAGTYSIHFDSLTISNGGAVIAKYDGSSGSPVWAKVAAGGSATAIASLGSKLYISGEYSDTLHLDGNKLTIFSGQAQGSGNIWLAMLDTSGSVQWVKAAGGHYFASSATSIDADIMGNVYVAGSFMDTMTFDGINLVGPEYGQGNIFIAKYDNSGSPIWAKSSEQGGGNINAANSVVCASDGSVYATGCFADSMSFDNIGPFVNTAGYNADLFVAKLGESAGIDMSAAENSNQWAYPNPARGWITVASGLIGTARISDALGRDVFKAALNGSSTTLDLSHLAAGTYFLRIGERATPIVLEK